MYPFPHTVTPAVRSHMDAQMAFVNDLSKSMFNSFQKLCDLNIQLTQTLLEESTLTGQQLITAERPTETLSAAASRAQPATQKLQAYQQHISRVAADTQVELAQVTERHVQETSRTARALADEVQRVASEETERVSRNQQETIRRFTDPFQRDGAQGARTGNGMGASMQSAQGGSQTGEGAGSMQAGQAGSTAGAGRTGTTTVTPGGARKET